MSFQHGLSGLNVTSQSLDVIGNNIANTNTVGFKQAEAQFADLYANSLSGATGNNIGIGARVAEVAQEFTQGTITPTSNPLDIAVNGNGFFRMSDNGAITYSRNGQFHLDSNGFIVNNNDLNLTGYTVDNNGSIQPTNPVNLRVSTAALSPQPTTAFSAELNLDSRTTVPAPLPAFNATDPSTYNGTTSGTIFDSLGNAHVLSIYFQKNNANAWDMFATIDGQTTPTGTPVGVTLNGGGSEAVTFDTSGNLTAPAAPIAVSVDLATLNPTLGATSPLDFTLDLSGTTQFGTNFGVNALSQDGYSSGSLAGFSIDGEGFLSGNYSNGESRTLGQIVLANFANPQGLTPIGDNQWIESNTSGQPLVGSPGTGTMGLLQSSAVEDSNVDLTTELVNLITMQRSYQANAKTIETQDAILQTLVNL